ncbi:ferric-chelate reductase [Cryptococcus neoformans]|nr:ferric-chelate reductase [Cryptococcus neoformans var. grubii]OXC59780.1 ferric-chelate reductase [Cryptococcus neoformans var. grubii MW-RSA852]
MNIFHRWIAIVTAFQGMAHSIAWTWIERDVIALMFQEMYWKAGIFPIRDKWYEFFLIAHIVLALATLTLLFYHVTVYGTDYNGWLRGCVAVWVFDRFIRIVRVQVLSFKAVAGNNAVMVATGGEKGLIRLTVTSSIRHIPKPGQHYYIYTPMSITPWEDHPFTIGSWEVDKSSTTLHFLMGTKDGATRRMRKMVNKAISGQADLRVLVEGPYGHTSPVYRFENVPFIAGGSGITAALPYLHDLVSRRSIGKCVTKKVTLVWSLRTLTMRRMFYPKSCRYRMVLRDWTLIFRFMSPQTQGLLRLLSKKLKATLWLTTILLPCLPLRSKSHFLPLPPNPRLRKRCLSVDQKCAPSFKPRF